MQEVGLDLSHAQPQLLTEELARNAALLVTMGLRREVLLCPELRRENWPLPDPKNLPTEETRKVRDEVEQRVVSLITREELR